MVLQAASPSQESIAVALQPDFRRRQWREIFPGLLAVPFVSVWHGRRGGLGSGCISALGSSWRSCQVGRDLEGRRREDGWQGGAVWLDPQDGARLQEWLSQVAVHLKGGSVFRGQLWVFLSAFGGGGLVAKLCPTLATPWTIACQAPLSMEFFFFLQYKKTFNATCSLWPGQAPPHTLRILLGESLLHSFSHFGVQEVASQAFNVIQRQAAQGPLIIPLELIQDSAGIEILHSHFLLQGNLPDPGIEPRSLALQKDSLPTDLQGATGLCFQDLAKIWGNIAISTRAYLWYF